jgi:hypothetical protein
LKEKNAPDPPLPIASILIEKTFAGTTHDPLAGLVGTPVVGRI